jgi:hypothetical protein
MSRALRRRYGRAETRKQAAAAIARGAQDLVTRAATAYDNFIEVIMRQGSISRDEAERVYRVYDKARVLDKKHMHTSGHINVKHGAFLDKVVILRALAGAK